MSRWSRARVTFMLGALALLSALAAPGCAKKPNMRVHHAEVSGMQIGIGQIGIMMTIVVEVYNPNSYDVALRAMRGEVLLAKQYKLPVQFQAPGDGVWMNAKRVTTMRVPVTVPPQVAFAIARDAALGADIPYHLTGSADVTGTRTFKVEKDDYSVDEEGAISRAQLDASLRAMNPFAPH